MTNEIEPLSSNDDAQIETSDIVLDEMETSEKAIVLLDRILAIRGKNFSLDANKVQRIDTPCIEVLLSCARLWRNDEHSIKIKSPSDQFIGALECLGLAKQNIEVEVN